MLLTGVISLIVGIGSALILDYVRTSAPKLEYEIISSSAFSGQQKIGMVAIDLQNSGRTALELVTARIQIKDVEIMETKTEGFPRKSFTESNTKDTYALDMPFWNPSEHGRIFLLLKFTTADLPTPEIELRAKGVTGTQRTKERSEKKQKLEPAIAASIAALSTLGAFIALRVLRARRDKRASYTTSHSDDQRDVAAYVLNVRGLSAEAHDLRSATRRLPYWSIADELTQRALVKNDAEHTRKLLSALETLLKYAAIAETSCLLLNYNIARLYNSVGDTEHAKAALCAARKENHKVIEKRIAFTRDLQTIAPADVSLDFPEANRKDAE